MSTRLEPVGPRFSEVVAEHRPVLTALAQRLTGNPSDAQDLVQDTLERALKAFARLRPGSNARGWLVTILHNRFIDQCRRRKAAPVVRSLEPEANVPAPPAAEAPRWAAITPDQLSEAVAALDEEFRRVYELRETAGKSYDEIATELGIPKATVGTRLLRARRQLKKALEKVIA